MAKKILVVVDAQNDFITGALGNKECDVATNVIADEIRSGKYDDVIFTRDTHDENYLNTQEGSKLPVEHCILGTQGWELHPEIDALAKENNSLIFDKPTFGSMGLAGCLNGIQKVAAIDELELVGLCTDICVISNALLLKAILPETRIVVNSDCCAGVTPESHENALKAMAACQIEIR